MPAPSSSEIQSVLQVIAGKEGLVLPPQLAAKIAMQSGRNLRRAVLMLEAAKVASPILSQSTPIPAMDWERYIGGLAAEIAKEQSPKQLLACR